MPRRLAEDEEWDEDDSDWEDEEEAFDEAEEDEEEPTIPCPYCRRQIHEDSPRCPHCEQYVSAEDAPPGRKPWWIILGTLLGLYVVYRWIRD